MKLGRYWQLLRHPGAPRLVVSVLIGRIPIGIFGLAIVLLVRQETGSFAQAGVASAAWALGAGLVAPLQGRLVDRFGQPAVLIPSTLLNATAVAAFVLGARAGADTWLLATFAGLGGAALPPLGACMRSVWADAFADDASARNTAYTFESMIAELFYIVGPAITTLLIAFSSPSGALLVAIGLSAAGTIGFATAPLARAWRSERIVRPRAGALAAPGMRTLMYSIVPTGVAFGVLRSRDAGVRRRAGPLGKPRRDPAVGDGRRKPARRPLVRRATLERSDRDALHRPARAVHPAACCRC